MKELIKVVLTILFFNTTKRIMIALSICALEIISAFVGVLSSLLAEPQFIWNNIKSYLDAYDNPTNANISVNPHTPVQTVQDATSRIVSNFSNTY
jgi:hypothetical protein